MLWQNLYPADVPQRCEAAQSCSDPMVVVPLTVLLLDARATNCASTVPTHTPFAAPRAQQSLRYSGSVTRPKRQEETHRQCAWFAGSRGPCAMQMIDAAASRTSALQHRLTHLGSSEIPLLLTGLF